MAETCKFNDYTYIPETDCAVLAALRNDDLSKQRYSAYTKFSKELDYLATKINNGGERIRKQHVKLHKDHKQAVTDKAHRL